MSEKISLCFICDENYVMPTVVAISSVIINKNKEDVYDIYVVSNNLSVESTDILEELGSESARIIVVKTDNNDKYGRFAMKSTYVTTTSLYKFDLPYLLPVELGKVLYLDGDIIAQKNVAPIFNEDIENVYAGVVKDFYVELKDKDDFRQRLNMNHKGYFNSGVLLLNLKKMREDNLPELLFQYRNSNKDKYMDQDTFNVVLKENIKYLSPFYNFMSACWVYNKDEIADYYKIGMVDTKYEWIKEALVIHYTGLKPWKYFDYFAADIWLHYYLLSPLKDVLLVRRSLNDERNVKKDNELATVKKTVTEQKKKNEILQNHLMIVEKKVNNLTRELKSVKNGWSFRIGRVITFIPRMLKKCLKL